MLAVADFFSVEVWTALGLVRYHVFFVIRLVTREAHIAGITPEPNGPLMKQVARNLTDGMDGFLRGCRYLIHDRAGVFSEDFRMILVAASVESVRLPARSPNLNAFAERFVRTIKESCLDRIVMIEESSLQRATSEFMSHYHGERNHQGLENKIRPEFALFPSAGTVKRQKRLGGLLSYYYREAPCECSCWNFRTVRRWSAVCIITNCGRLPEAAVHT